MMLHRLEESHHRSFVGLKEEIARQVWCRQKDLSKPCVRSMDTMKRFPCASWVAESARRRYATEA